MDRWTMSMVNSPEGDDHAAADPADPDAQAELERRYHTTRDAPTRTRYQMVLLNAQGHTPPQIARLVRCHPTPSAASSSASLAVGQTRCRTGPTLASHPTTRPPGSRNWSGSPTWTAGSARRWRTVAVHRETMRIVLAHVDRCRSRPADAADEAGQDREPVLRLDRHRRHCQEPRVFMVTNWRRARVPDDVLRGPVGHDEATPVTDRHYHYREGVADRRETDLLVGPLWYESDAAVRIHLPGRLGHGDL